MIYRRWWCSMTITLRKYKCVYGVGKCWWWFQYISIISKYPCLVRSVLIKIYDTWLIHMRALSAERRTSQHQKQQMDFFNSTTFQLPTHRLRIRSVIWYIIIVLSIMMYICVDVVIVYRVWALQVVACTNITPRHIMWHCGNNRQHRIEQNKHLHGRQAMPCHDVKILYARINPLVNCFQRIHSSNKCPTASMTGEIKTNRGKAIERIEQCQM